VKPSSMTEIEGTEKKATKKMPPSVQKYYSENEIKVFLYSRPFKKTNVKSNNEFKVWNWIFLFVFFLLLLCLKLPSMKNQDLWISNCFFITKDKLPTHLRRSEIEEVKEVTRISFSHQKLTTTTTTKQVILSPIDNAIDSILKKNQELLEIITTHENGKDNISPFTMVLKGVIDAAVNGGVSMYQDAFFTAEYAKENPTKQPSVQKLKQALAEQMDILAKGLSIHGKICPEDMSALQEQLEAQFTVIKSKVKV
jgi:hypothetical protein